MVQWLRVYAPNAQGLGSIPGQGTRSHMLQSGPSPGKKKMKLPYGPRIPLLGTYPDKTVIQKDTRTPMFTAALFITANMRKQPKRPSTSEQVNSVAHTRRGLPLSHGRECDSAICSNVGGPRDYHTKRRKSDRARQMPCDITGMQNLKYGTNELSCKTQRDSQLQGTKLWLPRGGGWGGAKRE